MNWQTFGHKTVKNILTRQLGNLNFPNAYLFAGPEGIGKKTLALEFAKKVLETENLENHPDYLLLDTEGDITVEQAINFTSQLSYKPFVAAKKVAIINNSEKLNSHSSNALLKTLEEPSQNTIIILISSQARLLPTIVSRCQVLRFSGFSVSELESFAEINKLKASEEILDLSFGRINRLKKLSAEKEYVTSEYVATKRYQDFAEMDLEEKLLAINEYAELESEDLEKKLMLWLNWQTAHIKENVKAYKKLDALSESLQGIKMNKNKKLILQSLFLRI